MNTFKKIMLVWAVLLPVLTITLNAEGQTLSLYTATTPLFAYDPNTGWHIIDAKVDTNWDYYHDPHRPNAPGTVEDAIYLMPFDGASGHTDNGPGGGETNPIYWTLDGLVEGNYSTMDQGPGAPGASQSLGVSATDIVRFPLNQRDTRVVAIFNTEKIRAINTDPGAVLKAKFKWSVDYLMDWINPGYYQQAPTHLYVSIYPDVNATNYWRSPPDANDPDIPTIYFPHLGVHITDLNKLQHEFDPNGAGIQFAEKGIDIRVNEGPWPSITGLQPLTDWYLQEYGAQFYEIDFTDEVRQILKLNPNLEWIGFTIRGSLDGENVLLQMHGGFLPGAIPPTLDIQVTKYVGDVNDNNSVDFVDFALFSQDYGKTNGLYKADLNVDRNVDIADLDKFALNWLAGK